MTHTLEELIPDYIQGLPAYVPGKPVEEVEQDQVRYIRKGVGEMDRSEGAGWEGAARRAELAARRGTGLQGKFIRLRHPGEASSEIRAKGLTLTVYRRRADEDKRPFSCITSRS